MPPKISPNLSVGGKSVFVNQVGTAPLSLPLPHFPQPTSFFSFHQHYHNSSSKQSYHYHHLPLSSISPSPQPLPYFFFILNTIMGLLFSSP